MPLLARYASRRRTMKKPLFALLVATGLYCAGPQALAQLGGLQRLPTLPSLPNLPATSQDANRTLRQVERNVLAPLDLQGLRQRTIDELLNRDRERFERDPTGEPMLRGELSLYAPSPALLDAARAAGFVVLRERVLDALDVRIVVLRVPPGNSTAAALTVLRAMAPDAAIDFNHVYTGSGPTPAARSPATADRPAATPTAAAPGSAGIRIGLVDGALDTRHPALRDADIRMRRCAQAQRPSAHASAIASLLVGNAGAFHGVVPQATLFAADVGCGDSAVDAIADALGWMVLERVPVINVSLVGPPNRTLEQVVHAVIGRGHVIVAAVGNDGPAAPPLYPAAYAGVVGVTGVDPARRVLPEALQGPQVMFAAPGAQVAVAAGASDYAAARGTSYATPLVAGLIALRLREANPDAAARTLDALALDAIDLGLPGRDRVYGHGLVGEGQRIDPLALR
jgi:subtilisin family serine protease